MVVSLLRWLPSWFWQGRKRIVTTCRFCSWDVFELLLWTNWAWSHCWFEYWKNISTHPCPWVLGVAFRDSWSWRFGCWYFHVVGPYGWKTRYRRKHIDMKALSDIKAVSREKDLTMLLLIWQLSTYYRSLQTDDSWQCVNKWRQLIR